MNAKKHLSFTQLRSMLSDRLQEIPDWRQKSKTAISIHDAAMTGFACMYFQDPSLLQFQKRMQEEQHRNNLETLFGIKNIPKESQMREINDAIDSEFYRPVLKDLYSRLQRGKHLQEFQIFKNTYYFPIDGSQFFSSSDIHCDQCLVKEHRNGSKTYSHQVLQGGIMHPDCSEVIPFMPEQIINTDGTDKQDCEMNAAKRFLQKLRCDFPRLKLMIGGDALFSRQPIIENILSYNFHYLFTAKPTDHKYMTQWVDGCDSLKDIQFTDDKDRLHKYEWLNHVPLHGGKEAIGVNFLRCTVTGTNKKGQEEILYRSSWVTDILIDAENIKTLVRAGRCRWKNENECFNVMKNQGYCMEHNYGHGDKHLAYNFYLLTLLAFSFHQIFELVDSQYQRCRERFGSKKHFWEKLRSWIDLLIFKTWEHLLDFALASKKGLLHWAHAP